MKTMLENLFSFMLPEQASTSGHYTDDIFYVLMGLSVISFIILIGVIIFFLIRYKRRKEGEKTGNFTESHAIEIFWIVIPTIVFVAIAIWGWQAYRVLEYPPKDAYVVQVTAKQWSWEFGHTYGDKEVKNTADLYVPVGRPVALEMTSLDVVHSFFVPAFRIKKDVVPGMKTRVWFEAKHTGDFDVYCTEFCGTAHSRMLAKIHVMEAGEFDSWLAQQASASTSESPAVKGAKLYESKGCNSCHTVDGEDDIGPSFKGIYGHSVKFSDGTSLAAVDDVYIRESILNPKAKIVEGYKPKMNSFEGQITEEEISYIIEYIKTLK